MYNFKTSGLLLTSDFLSKNGFQDLISPFYRWLGKVLFITEGTDYADFIKLFFIAF